MDLSKHKTYKLMSIHEKINLKHNITFQYELPSLFVIRCNDAAHPEYYTQLMFRKN